MTLISFEQAIADTDTSKRHLLLGNGFSIALFPDRFRYGSLLDDVDFSRVPHIQSAFESLETTDFELVIRALRDAERVCQAYSVSDSIRASMHTDADMLKEMLVQAIAGRHPERPNAISEDQFAACRRFLAHFSGDIRNRKPEGGKDHRGMIYTVNYDLLLYWTLLHTEIDPEQASPNVGDAVAIEHDDGFRPPDDDPDAPYVTWDAEGAADGQTVHYLHGALHLFDDGPDLQKCCWQRSGQVPLIDQIRIALNDDKFPLYVSEGDNDAKLTRIRHSGYLLRSLKSFAAVCRSKDMSLFVFGHSLAENDDHILRHIEKGKFPKLYVSLYGDPTTLANRAIITRALQIKESRPDRFPLDVYFFDANSAGVWGSSA